jgi:hypothetical protein
MGDDKQVGWQYRVFETALKRMEEGGLYPIVEYKSEASAFIEGIELHDQYYLQPDELKQSLNTYFEHFQQRPKNADAYVSFLSKHLCFGSDWWPTDEEGKPLPKICEHCGNDGRMLMKDNLCDFHENYSIWYDGNTYDVRKVTLWTKGLKPPLKEYLLQKAIKRSFYNIGGLSINRKIWKLALSYGVVNRKTLPSISEIIADVDKVLTVAIITNNFYEPYFEDDDAYIAPEQEVIQRYERDKEYY